MNYKAPLDGYYRVSSTIIVASPTGEFEEVANSEYRWWTFWLPRTITREKYSAESNYSGSEVKYLKQGEEVISKHEIYRIGG